MLDASHPLFLLVYQNLCFYKWRKNTNFKFFKTSNTPIQCFLGVYIVLNLFEYSGYRAFYFCCTIYISISKYIHQIYRYFGRFAAWITYSKITRKYTFSLRILLNTVILILHSACMPIIFATYVCWCGALRAVTNTLLFAIFYVCFFFMSTVILLIVILLSISMYSYYI